MKTCRWSALTLLVLATVLSSAGTTHAAAAFTDTFNYPAGALAGNGPPAGSPTGQGAWANFSGQAVVSPGGLTYPGATPDANKATIAGLGASLGDDAVANTAQIGGSGGLAGSGGGVAWVGFLMNQASGATPPAGYAVVSVGPRSSSAGIAIGLLDQEGIYGIDNNVQSPVQRARTTVACNSTVVLLVAKLDFNTGMEYIFVNPSLAAEPAVSTANASQAMTSAFQSAGINQVALVAGSNSATFNIGGLRVGGNYADVLPAATGHPAFFTGESVLSNGVYFLQFPSGNPFGYYSYLTDPKYIYHFDLGYEYVFDANDGRSGVYFYDFASSTFFYTSPGFPFPYLYDFTLNSTVYYYPDPNNPGRYNTNGVRYFYVFSTGQIISK